MGEASLGGREIEMEVETEVEMEQHSTTISCMSVTLGIRPGGPRHDLQSCVG